MITGGIDLVPHHWPRDVEIWRIDLDRYRFDVNAGVLCAEEIARAGSFKFAEHRRRFVAAHHALRHVLGITLGRDPASLVFTTGDLGKPLLAHAPSLQFNLSHSERECLIGTSARRPIGVDVESIRPVVDAAALVNRHFTATEVAEWQQAPAAGRDERFLLGWTRKEACLKAIGCGLSLGPRAIEVGCHSGASTATVDAEGGRVAVHVSSYSLDKTAVAAVALA